MVLDSVQNSYSIIHPFWNAKVHYITFFLYLFFTSLAESSRINFPNNSVGAGRLPSDKNDLPLKNNTESKCQSPEPFIHDLLSTMPLDA